MEGQHQQQQLIFCSLCETHPTLTIAAKKSFLVHKCGSPLPIHGDCLATKKDPVRCWNCLEAVVESACSGISNETFFDVLHDMALEKGGLRDRCVGCNKDVPFVVDHFVVSDDGVANCTAEGVLCFFCVFRDNRICGLCKSRFDGHVKFYRTASPTTTTTTSRKFFHFCLPLSFSVSPLSPCLFCVFCSAFFVLRRFRSDRFFI